MVLNFRMLSDRELIAQVYCCTTSTGLELDLIRRLEAALDRFQDQDEELKHYHNKLSEALNKTTQVLSSC
jgi:hypothetical protein